MTDKEKLANIKEWINSFNLECEQEEYTDTGRAWELFGQIVELIDHE